MIEYIKTDELIRALQEYERVTNEDIMTIGTFIQLLIHEGLGHCVSSSDKLTGQLLKTATRKWRDHTGR